MYQNDLTLKMGDLDARRIGNVPKVMELLMAYLVLNLGIFSFFKKPSTLNQRATLPDVVWKGFVEWYLLGCFLKGV